MATQRFSDNNAINNGTAKTNLSLSDIVPVQHVTGDDNSDYKVTLAQLQATPYGTCGTASATADKVVTLSNYPATYTPAVGSKVLVSFTNSNTASTQMKLKVGAQASAYPCVCRGVAMTSGSVKAGAILEFAFTGDKWNTNFVDNDSAINSALTTQLANYREVRVGEIYNSNSYWKVEVNGFYGRPLLFNCYGSSGLYDICMFGIDCTKKLIRIGNSSTQITYKFKNPSASGNKGTLYIKSNQANISHTIFFTGLFSKENPRLLEATEEEWNNATSF